VPPPHGAGTYLRGKSGRLRWKSKYSSISFSSIPNISGDQSSRVRLQLRPHQHGDHTDDDGATIFRHACRMGLEGIVSKRLTAPYRSGPSRDWLKVKNPDSPATIRARDAGHALAKSTSVVAAARRDRNF
jgi:hypothetical protein